MSQHPPTTSPVSCSSSQGQAPPVVKIASKIFVSGLIEGEGEEQLRQLFSAYGEVTEVVVDNTCATVTFHEEDVARQLEERQGILLDGRKLNIARVLEEQVEAPFYIAGVPTSYPYQDIGLSSSYPSYQLPTYPMWYPPPTASTFYDPAISDCGPVHHSQLPSTLTTAPFNQYSVPPPTPTNIIEQTNFDKNVFSFDTTNTVASQLEQNKNPSRPKLGCCHVCSTPSVQGVAPLHSHIQTYGGNQLQPMTPMTPSLHTGYMYPPTPTPTLLPPMTPTYYLPPTPSYMMYHPHGHSQPAEPAAPHPSYFTQIKPSHLGNPLEENLSSHKFNSSMVYFTSPFKKFTKFRGTPTKARFPIRTAPSPQSYRGRGSSGPSRGGDGNSSWYQQGDRWGQKTGVEIESQEREVGPDLLEGL